MLDADTYGHPFKSLWRRAGLWRACIFGSVAFASATYFFPPAYLIRLAPKVFHKHFENAAPTEIRNPFIFSDPDRIVHDFVPFAGKRLPLPPGNWSPLLTAQVGPNGEFIFLSMMRIDAGRVTGILTAKASTAPIPDAAISPDFTQPCHDDRMIGKLNLSQPNRESCAFATIAPLILQNIIMDSDLGKATLGRIMSLGYPVPTVMIHMGWQMSRPLTVSSDIAAVDYFSLDPRDPKLVPDKSAFENWAQSLNRAFS